MKKIFFALFTVIATSAIFAFDKQANVKDMYSEIRNKPIYIEETIYTLQDKNGKVEEEPTLRRTLRWYDWSNMAFCTLGYNDAGQPYLYEKVNFNSNGLVSTYTRKSKTGTISRKYVYNDTFSAYDVFSTTNNEKEQKTSSFSIEKGLSGFDLFDYTYDADGKITKTKKTTGYPSSGDLRKDAQDFVNTGTVYYYFYENDKLSSITMETSTEKSRKVSYFVNNKKIRTENYTINKNGDVEKETTSDVSYIYSYTYDDNENWIQKDSYYEDKDDEIKYSHPLLRTKRTIQYNGKAPSVQEPSVLFAFDSTEEDLDTNKLGSSSSDSANDTSIAAENIYAQPFTAIKKDMIDDKDTLYIVFNAPQKVNEYTDNVSLIIRKKQGAEPEVYINWKEFLSQGTCYVTYRIDNEKARTEEWTVSTDEKASFFDGDALELILKLSKATQFVARTTPFNEPPCTAIFDISSLRNLAPEYSWLYKKDW